MTGATLANFVIVLCILRKRLYKYNIIPPTLDTLGDKRFVQSPEEKNV